MADVIITDPPYGTGGYRVSAPGLGRRLVKESWDDGDFTWLDLTTAPSAVVFCFGPRIEDLLAGFRRRGLRQRPSLYWRKTNPRIPFHGAMATSIESIWVASSDDKFRLIGGYDVFDYRIVSSSTDPNGHPYEKPLSLMAWIIGKLPPSQATILDPFMGRGTTLRAAKDAGRRAIGIEINERYCELAAQRMSQEVLDFGGAA